MTIRGKVPVVPALSCAQIEQRALLLIQQAYPQLLKEPSPFPVADFFERDLRRILKFEYDVQELPAGIEGITDPREKVVTLSPTTYERLLCGDGRARFTASHEFGHVVLHARFLRDRIIDNRGALKLCRGDIPPYRDPEYQADAFAASLLMPAIHVRRLIADGADKMDLARTFSVSLQAAEVRIKKLPLYLK